jgi:hypothetical protein
MTTAAPATLERASTKEQAKAAAITDRERAEEVARLEKLFVNIDAVRAWAKLQVVPKVLDNRGNQIIGFEVDPAMIARFCEEITACLQDKAGAEYEGKVRQGKVPDGTTRHVLS